MYSQSAIADKISISKSVIFIPLSKNLKRLLFLFLFKTTTLKVSSIFIVSLQRYSKYALSWKSIQQIQIYPDFYGIYSNVIQRVYSMVDTFNSGLEIIKWFDQHKYYFRLKGLHDNDTLVQVYSLYYLWSRLSFNDWIEFVRRRSAEGGCFSDLHLVELTLALFHFQ